MKKTILILGLILIVAFVSSYIFIPNTLTVSKLMYVESSDRIVYDLLLTNKSKANWWPQKDADNLKTLDSTTFKYENTYYKFLDANFTSTSSMITKGDAVFKGTLSSLFEGENAFKLVWSVSITNNYNPITRLLNYYKAVSIKKDITKILEQFGSFVVKEENIYGIKIKRTIVKDTLLLTTNKSMNHYPSVSETYEIVNALEDFAKTNSATKTNSPMLNVIETYKGDFNVTVALPVDKSIETKAGFFVNKMFPGNILEAEIKGERKIIDNGFLQMKNYMKDFKLTAPAMPFEMMITDRSIEKDSTKWVTKLYYPIF